MSKSKGTKEDSKQLEIKGEMSKQQSDVQATPI